MRASVARCFAVLALVAACVTGAVAVSGPEKSGAAPSRIACGVERWTVKTLQDKPILRPARTTTVRYLVTRPASAHLPSSRLPFEHNVFTVTAAVVLVRPESDGDFH